MSPARKLPFPGLRQPGGMLTCSHASTNGRREAAVTRKLLVATSCLRKVMSCSSFSPVSTGGRPSWKTSRPNLFGFVVLELVLCVHPGSHERPNHCLKARRGRLQLGGACLIALALVCREFLLVQGHGLCLECGWPLSVLCLACRLQYLAPLHSFRLTLLSLSDASNIFSLLCSLLLEIARASGVRCTDGALRALV